MTKKHNSSRNLAMPSKRTKRESSELGTYILLSVIVAIFGIISALDIYLPRTLNIAIVIIGGVTLFYLGFVKPEYSLLFLVAYLPFSEVFIGQFGIEVVGLNITNILMSIVIIGWIFNTTLKNERLFHKSTLNPLIIIFCIGGIVSLIRTKFLYADYYLQGNLFILFKRWLTPILLYFIGLNMIKDKHNFKKVIFIIMLTTLIIAAMATREYMIFGDRGSIDESRIGSVFGNPNSLGAFLVYNMFFFLGFFLFNMHSFKYWLLFIPFLICFRGIMVTFSRGAYLAFAFAGLLTMFFRSKPIFILSLILILITLFLVPYFLPAGIRYRMAETFGGEKIISTDINDVVDKSAGARLGIWGGAIKMIGDRPLFGYGYSMFPYLIGNYAPGFSGFDAHNLYLTIASEMGIPMLIVFLIILFMLIKNSFWLLKNTKDKYFKSFALGMLGGIFGLFVANLFGSRLLYTESISSYFWLLSGLLMRAVIMHKSTQLK
jgi:O-antigen ligase